MTSYRELDDARVLETARGLAPALARPLLALHAGVAALVLLLRAGVASLVLRLRVSTEIATISEVETLTSDLSRKIWQKIAILEHASPAVRA